MSFPIPLVLSLVSSYFIGSFPTSFILAKILKGIDIRQVGSGNVGATNVLRAVGKLPALATLIVDLVKGIFVVTIITNFFYSFVSNNLDYEFFRIILGLVAICGHIWSIFLKFSGGKGVATTLGVAICVSPMILIPALAIWLIVFFLTNYVSLASIALSISLPLFAVIFNQSRYIIIFAITLCILISYKHKENIKRLLRGEENKTIIFRRRAS